MIATSNNWKLRPQDRTVTIGVEEKDFPPRNYDELPIPQMLCPLNNYKIVGHQFANSSNILKRTWWIGLTHTEYFTALVGWDWRNTILKDGFIKVCGYNPLLKEEDGIDTIVPRHLYKKWLRTFAAVLVPSPFKHHANVTAETMMSKNVVITRPTAPFNINPSPLVHGHNAIIVKDEEELKKYRGEFLMDKKTQKAIGENALLTAQQHFDMNICINRWEEFFEHVVNWS